MTRPKLTGECVDCGKRVSIYREGGGLRGHRCADGVIWVGKSAKPGTVESKP